MLVKEGRETRGKALPTWQSVLCPGPSFVQRRPEFEEHRPHFHRDKPSVGDARFGDAAWHRGNPLSPKLGRPILTDALLVAYDVRRLRISASEN